MTYEVPLVGERPPPKPRGRPRQLQPSPQYQARLLQIVETAADVFHREGYDAGSLDHVAEALNLRKASLYHYVTSKSQLLYYVFDHALTVGLERLDAFGTIEDPADRLASLISHQVSIVAEERSLFSVFFSTRPRLDDDFESRIHEKESAYMRRYVDAVQAAMDAGLIPSGNPRYTAQAILGMSSWVYKWFDPKQDDWADVCRNFIQLVLHAQVPIALPSSQDILHRRDSTPLGVTQA